MMVLIKGILGEKNRGRLAIQLLLFLAIIYSGCVTACAHTIQIVGPSSITIPTGNTQYAKYYVYCDGILLNDDNSDYIDGLGSYSTYPDVGKTSAYLDAGIYGGKKIGLFAKKAGKHTLTLEASVSFYEEDTNGFQEEKILKTKKTVVVRSTKSKKICVDGWLANYSTRNNQFTVNLLNFGSKPITILSSGATAINSDYKIFDRSLKIAGANNVIIKSGKKKKVKFQVIGSNTWYYGGEFTILCRCIYNGKQYDLKIYPAPYISGQKGKTKVKINGKWKRTSDYLKTL